jgi:D-serine deaminase-like pyridoxal phosphate-dependent protein
LIALDDTPTKPKIRAVIRAVAKWRNVAAILDTPENMEKIAKMEAELDRLMEALGVEVDEEKKKKTKAGAPSTLALLYF